MPMCIRVQFTPRAELEDPWDATRRIITLNSELNDCFALRALRDILTELDVEQDDFGARCWCGEPIELLPRIPEQRRSDEVINHGA
jgi:hypothetical protein